MKHLKLEELVQFALGKNVTRLKKFGKCDLYSGRF